MKGIQRSGEAFILLTPLPSFIRKEIKHPCVRIMRLKVRHAKPNEPNLAKTIPRLDRPKRIKQIKRRLAKRNVIPRRTALK